MSIDYVEKPQNVMEIELMIRKRKTNLNYKLEKSSIHFRWSLLFRIGIIYLHSNLCNNAFVSDQVNLGMFWWVSSF